MRVENLFMLKKLGTILLAISISALLSSCLVEKDDDVKKVSRTTDTLRIYQSGDFIDYNVEAQANSGVSTTTRRGTLRIRWENTATFNDPFGNPISPDLKETTTLTYDGSTGPDAIIFRYISQVNTDPAAPSQGSIILHAIDDGTLTYYWPYPIDTSPSTTPVSTPVIFDSPVTFGTPANSPQEFSVMDCTPAECPTNSKIYEYRNYFEVVGDSREIPTELAIFSNPFEVNLSGGTQPQNALGLSFVTDIFDICGDSTQTITHNGTMFVMPQIGVIRIDNTCRNTSTGDSVGYRITARDTNINF